MDFVGDLEKYSFSGGIEENPECSTFKREWDLQGVETCETKKCFGGILQLKKKKKKLGRLENQDQGMVSQ